LGNAAIDIDIQNNAQVPFAHRMGLISDELFEVNFFFPFLTVICT